MPYQYPDDVVAAILHHMNDDHPDDSAVIARAFVDAGALSARMTGLDGDAGEWDVELPGGERRAARLAWPGGPIDDRPGVRREIVALYDAARDRLGLPPRGSAS